MEIGDIFIYMYVCMYSFFYGTFTCMSTNNLDSATNWTFHAGWSTLTLRTVLLHTHRGRKGNKLKRRRDRGREARQIESGIQKKQGLRSQL